jgi:hypothetical protein
VDAVKRRGRRRPTSRQGGSGSSGLWEVKSSQVKDGSPSAISIDTRPPLLASGAHSIGFRRLSVVYIDLT